ncbi:hypothetical protein ACFYXF_03715 [Streptomyces sp. NPDC002680]|uniref:hypothetical protein n=1 Tax=Streptomyces sp. NPDC002680 TaxID=3364659 RepID=UPI00368AD7AF
MPASDVGDVPVGVVEVHQVGEHLPQRPRLRVGSHQGDLGPGVLQLGDDCGGTASADRGDHTGLAHRVTGGELTLGAVPARLEEREREITAQAETRREQVAQLTARLDGLGRAAEEVRITRKTLPGLPGPGPPAPPAPKLPDHPAYQQIMTVFTAADHPPRARQVCEAKDLAVATNNINNVRLKPKRLAGRGILTETEQDLLTRPRPQPQPQPQPTDVATACPPVPHETKNRASCLIPPSKNSLTDRGRRSVADTAVLGIPPEQDLPDDLRHGHRPSSGASSRISTHQTHDLGIHDARHS